MKNIILLHGALGCTIDLEPLSAALESQGLRTLPMAFPGHGAAPFKSGFTIAAFAANLRDFITEKELTQPAVFGYSMGGYVALHAAAEYRQLLGPVVTLATKMNWDSETANRESQKLSPAALVQKAPAYVEQLRKLHGDKWESLLEKTGALMTDIAEKQYLSAERLQNIASPVMMGIGDKDHMVSLEETTLSRQMIPGAAMYMLPRTKHALESADAETLSLLIRNFITA